MNYILEHLNLALEQILIEKDKVLEAYELSCLKSDFRFAEFMKHESLHEASGLLRCAIHYMEEANEF